MDALANLPNSLPAEEQVRRLEQITSGADNRVRGAVHRIEQNPNEE